MGLVIPENEIGKVPQDGRRLEPVTHRRLTLPRTLGGLSGQLAKPEPKMIALG